jgi:lysozyme
MTAEEFIKSQEGCRTKAYQDTGGVWTVGYGSTGPDVNEGTVWTQEDCDKRLRLDLLMIEKDIERSVTVPLTENQITALSSFIYNVGFHAFQNSTLLKRLNEKEYDTAAEEFLRWDKDNGKRVKGLSERRARERKLFLT